MQGFPRHSNNAPGVVFFYLGRRGAVERGKRTFGDLDKDVRCDGLEWGALVEVAGDKAGVHGCRANFTVGILFVELARKENGAQLALAIPHVLAQLAEAHAAVHFVLAGKVGLQERVVGEEIVLGKRGHCGQRGPDGTACRSTRDSRQTKTG